MILLTSLKPHLHGFHCFKAAQAKHPDDYLAGLESIDLKEIDTAFNELENVNVKEASCNVDSAEGLEGEIYNFDKLNHIDVYVAPCSLEEDVSVICTYNRHNYII